MCNVLDQSGSASKPEHQPTGGSRPGDVQPGAGLGPLSNPARVSSRRREGILFVEDEPALRRLGRTVLERNGYHVFAAQSGVEALQLWPSCAAHVDILVTDMVMPAGVSGRDLALRLRAANPKLKVLYMSGYSTELFGDRRLRKAAFLGKPYDPVMLLDAVRQALDAGDARPHS